MAKKAPKSAQSRSAKKTKSRRPATFGLDKVRMFMVEGSSLPVAYKVDSLGRMTRVEIIRDKPTKSSRTGATPALSPFRRGINEDFRFRISSSSTKKKK